ncbi:MAG: aromatic ring-hydroxylating dioxygenase subunit alpha [Gammaproteobacteria bacterium]|jgi:phenylpropionate dioxygenase-like ring-hydroxylating dioxygenase large terminal subunit|nr:aromatic ring-hydroxylating dioxygenase subunit alpha [Gammaproteobacteria bacterium]MDP6616723.1 aromatic ring-hydroxylating dioxygenase subunit alpha [Gammaproteobacteria bacterium]MDP6695212.1 aromatic ring-hydroxylating dioxygenase subunit alpha [Gammaproteobacteria bacterium]
MEQSTGNWFPVISTRELRDKPLAKKRFGQALVFWRDSKGRAVCMRDICPHRGAKLSPGHIKDDVITCPFHGIEFDSQGHCARIPPEGERPIPDDFCVQTLTCFESGEYIWLWTGSDVDALSLPEPPRHSDMDGLPYGESTSIWPAHFTRCIENVCDFSHLPFVHRTTIGMFRSETQSNVEIEEIDQGFRAYLIEENKPAQCLEFLYPNLWMLKISSGFPMTAMFAPVDEHTTEVYGRTVYRSDFPGKRILMDLYTRISQFLVFREDWPIVAGQWPIDVKDVAGEKLLPSDAPVIAYRKLLHAHGNGHAGSLFSGPGTDMP